ncbi:MAG: hypothetical protein K9K35_09955 [Rhodoferax sp.]|nr:hypothetical protein [Rhodoferax sp.]
MSTKTKLFSSTQAGAPVLNGVAGSLIGLLDAVLVNGFGSQTATDVVVASNVATVTFGSSHSQIQHGVALISGATPAGLNGEKRVLSVTANSFTFATSGITDQTATGTILAKVAPAGWTKLFSGTNLAVYQRLAPESTGMVLRVDDTNATYANVRGYESMTDVSTGVGPFPTVAQVAAGRFWSKSNTASAGAIIWKVYADDRGFYYSCDNILSNTSYRAQVHYFGDINSNKSNDPYACILTGPPTNQAGTGTTLGECIGFNIWDESIISGNISRLSNGLGGSQPIYVYGTTTPITSDTSGSNNGFYPYPSLVDNGLYLIKPFVYRKSNGFRGYLPGVFFTPMSCTLYLDTGDMITGDGDFAGKNLYTQSLGQRNGVIFFDILSDWR